MGTVRRAERAWKKAEQSVQQLIAHAASALHQAAAQHYGPQSVLARTWSTGFSALWVVILLGICLILYYL